MGNGKKSNSSIPDGTYAFRCIKGQSTHAMTDLSQDNDSVISFNVDVADTIDDVCMEIRYMQYQNVFEDFVAYNDK